MISANGLILTNYHLASGPIEASGRKNNTTLNQPIEVSGLEVEYANSIDENGIIIYKKVEKVFLISNPSAKLAYGNKHDLALLKIDVKTDNFLNFSHSQPKINEYLMNLGFTMRTARLKSHKEKFGYDDANYDLRVSEGVYLGADSESTFLSSVDGGPGNSGSATVNSNGELVGLYFASTGNGIVNPEGIKRKHVRSGSIKKLFGL